MIDLTEMRILILSQFCTPEPVIKSIPFAEELSVRGHDVRILTGFPNYPGGKIYSGYRVKISQRETIAGIPILRVPLYPSHNSSILARGLNYSTFTSATLFPLLLGWRPDVVYVYNLPTLGLTSLLNRLFRGVPYIIDVQDLWPDSIIHSGMSRPFMRQILGVIASIAYQKASFAVGLSPGMVNELVKRGVRRERSAHIYNWCDENAIVTPPNSEERNRQNKTNSFTVLYAGNLGLLQGLESVIQAAAIVGNTTKRIKFKFMGSGVAEQQLKNLSQKIAPYNTKFIGQCSQKDAAMAMASSDVLLLHLKNLPLFDITIPSKTQAYLAMGRPILSAIGRDAATLVTNAKAGVSCCPGDPVSIANAILRLEKMSTDQLAELGRNGSEYYWKNLSLKIGVSHWETVFSRAVESKG